jgi:hypothetical protein
MFQQWLDPASTTEAVTVLSSAGQGYINALTWMPLLGVPLQANIAGVLFAAKGPMQEAHAWLR